MHNNRQPSVLKETLPSDQQDHNLITVAKGGGIALAGTVVTRILGYAYTVVLIWGLGGENFGLFTLSLAIIHFLGVLAYLGLDRGIIRFGSMNSLEIEKINVHKVTVTSLRVSIPISLLFLVVLVGVANLIASGIFHKPELAPLIRILALSIPLVSMQTLLLAATQALKKMEYSAYVLIVQSLTSVGFSGGFLALNFGLQSVAWSFVLSYLLGSGLALYFYIRLIPRTSVSAIPVGTILKFSIPLSMTQWIHYANERTEVFFLGLLPGAIDVGIYNLAWRLGGLETIFAESLNQIFAPFSSNLSHRREVKQLEGLYQTTAKWSFTGALIIYIIFSLFAVEIMKIFDPAFAIGSSVLIALGFAQLISALTGSCGTVLIMSGRSDLSLMNTIILFGSSITLDMLLIPKYGLVGAAWAGSITVVFINILRLVEVWFLLTILPFKWSIVKPMIAGAFSMGITYVIHMMLGSDSIVILIILSIICTLIYAAVIYLLKLDKEDALVIEMVYRKIIGPKKILEETGAIHRNKETS